MVKLLEQSYDLKIEFTEKKNGKKEKVMLFSKYYIIHFSLNLNKYYIVLLLLVDLRLGVYDLRIVVNND